MRAATHCGLLLISGLLISTTPPARAQTLLDTLNAPPVLGQSTGRVTIPAPAQRVPSAQTPGPQSPRVVAPRAPAQDYSAGGPIIASEGQDPTNGNGPEALPEPCSPGSPCLRPMPGGLATPVIGSGSNLLDVGVGQNFSAAVSRNARQVDQIASDIQAMEEARERRARASVAPGLDPEQPNRAPDAQAAVPTPTQAPIIPERRRSADGPCSSSSDITQLLSPSCLETLRSLRPGGTPFGGGVLGSLLAPGAPGGIAPPPIAAAPQVICGVAMFTQGAGGAMTPVPGGVVSFQVPDAPRCIEAGVRLGFGIPGVTNISLTPPVSPTVGVICYRPPSAPTTVSCVPQPQQQQRG